ncbi:MAG: HlyD family efflux transporter periplasmic adaptor subunit [Gammaproteobacteria bacterium]|jgi:adhesin transport system membrane fusion protein
MPPDDPKKINLNVSQGDPSNSNNAGPINLTINQGNPNNSNNANPINSKSINLGNLSNLGNLDIKNAAIDPKKLLQPKVVNYEFNCKNNVFFEAPRSINIIYYSIIILCALFVIWAYFSQIDEITNGMGKVIPSSHVKTLQSLDGGIISKIYVQNDDLVKKGQLLIKLEDTRFSSDYNQNYAQLMTLIAEIARLKAQINNSSQIDFPADLDNYPDLKLGQTKLFKTIMNSFKDEVDSLEKNLHLAEQESNLILPLVKQGLMSQLERIRLEKQVTEAKSKITDIVETFKTKAQTDLEDKDNLKSALEEKLKGLKDRMEHTEILSPVEGYINNFKLSTVGGVVKPGMDILDIVPLEEQLVVEARINPKDRAFIKEEQAATVKFPAYDSSIYGSLNATVISISPDTDKDEKNNEFYLVRLTTDKNYLADNIKFKIIPGMAATVNILTGKKRILMYFLRPVTKIKEFALKER